MFWTTKIIFFEINTPTYTTTHTNPWKFHYHMLRKRRKPNHSHILKKFHQNLTVQIVLLKAIKSWQGSSRNNMEKKHWHKVLEVKENVERLLMKGQVHCKMKFISTKRINNCKQNSENLMKIECKIRKLWIFEILLFFEEHFLNSRYEYSVSWWCDLFTIFHKLCIQKWWKYKSVKVVL